MIDPAISLLASLGGVLLFGTAAMHKLRHANAFAAALTEYRLLPDAMAPVTGRVLALLELAVSLALLWPATRAVAAVSGASLLLLYAGAIAINLHRGRHELDCGCGPASRRIGGWMVVRNLLLAIVLGSAIAPASDRLLGWGDAATIAGSLAVAVMLYASADLLFGRSLARPLPSTEHS